MASSRRVVFVRHGESGHNVFKEYVHRADNALTPHGRAQAAAVNLFLQDNTKGDPLHRIITSPMTRAIETALIATRGVTTTKQVDTSRPHVARVVTERHTGVPCDSGSGRVELSQRFPGLDFSELAESEWWYTDEEAAGASIQQRGGIFPYLDAELAMTFADPTPEQTVEAGGPFKDSQRLRELVVARAADISRFLAELPQSETRVAVFAHGGILRYLLRRDFRNCELAEYEWPLPPGPQPPKPLLVFQGGSKVAKPTGADAAMLSAPGAAK